MCSTGSYYFRITFSWRIWFWFTRVCCCVVDHHCWLVLPGQGCSGVRQVPPCLAPPPANKAFNSSRQEGWLPVLPVLPVATLLSCVILSDHPTDRHTHTCPTQSSRTHLALLTCHVRQPHHLKHSDLLELVYYRLTYVILLYVVRHK